MANPIQYVITVDSQGAITGLSKFQAGMQSVATQTTRVETQAKKATKEIGEFEKTMGRARRTVVAFVAVMAGRELIGGFKRLVESTIEFNSKMETAKLGIASILASSGGITDHVGKQVEGYKKLVAAQMMSVDIVKEIHKVNRETIATLDQIVRAYQETLPVALSRGFSPEQTLRFTKAIVQAAGAIGLNLDMLGEETRSLLTGVISPRTSRIATILAGGDLDAFREKIRNMQGDVAKFFPFLMSSLEQYERAGVESQKTWLAATSNLKDSFNRVLGQETIPLFERLKGIILDLDVFTQTNEFEDAAYRFNESLVNILDNLTDITKLFWEWKGVIGDIIKIAGVTGLGAVGAKVAGSVGGKITGLAGYGTTGMAAFGSGLAKTAGTAGAGIMAGQWLQEQDFWQDFLDKNVLAKAVSDMMQELTGTIYYHSKNMITFLIDAGKPIGEALGIYLEEGLESAIVFGMDRMAKFGWFLKETFLEIFSWIQDKVKAVEGYVPQKLKDRLGIKFTYPDFKSGIEEARRQQRLIDLGVSDRALLLNQRTMERQEKLLDLMPGFEKEAKKFENKWLAWESTRYGVVPRKAKGGKPRREETLEEGALMGFGSGYNFSPYQAPFMSDEEFEEIMDRAKKWQRFGADQERVYEKVERQQLQMVERVKAMGESPFDKWIEKYEEAQQAMSYGLITDEDYQKAIQRIFGIADAFEGLATSARDSFQTFFFDWFTGELKSFGDYVTAFSRSLASSLSRIIADNIINVSGLAFKSLGASLFSAGHSGGVIGHSAFAKRSVSPFAFVGAPRYHTGGTLGLQPNEVPFIGRRGEEIIPQGGKGRVVNIILENPQFMDQATMHATMRTIAIAAAEDIAPGAVIRDYENDGPTRTVIRGGR